MKNIIFILISLLMPQISMAQKTIFDEIEGLNQLADGYMSYQKTWTMGSKELQYNYKNMSQDDIKKFRRILLDYEEQASLSNHYECHEANADTTSYRMMVPILISHQDSLNPNGIKDNYAIRADILNCGLKGTLSVHQKASIFVEGNTFDDSYITNLFDSQIKTAHVKPINVKFRKEDDLTSYIPEMDMEIRSDESFTPGELYIFPDEQKGFCEKLEKYILDSQSIMNTIHYFKIRKGIGKSLNKNYKITYFKFNTEDEYTFPFFLAIVYQGKLRLLKGKSPLVYIPAYWFMTAEEKKARGIMEK